MELSRIFDGKKFMWDGKTYTAKREAAKVAQRYKANGFEVEIVKEGGQHFVFTRRVVKAE